MIINPYRFGAAGPTPHRYWGFLFPTGVNVGLNEVQFRTAIGGPNVATGGTAYATSSFSGTYLPANAFDGNAGTWWNNAGNAANSRLWYDFGAANPKMIVEGTYYYADVGRAPADVILQYSDDGVTWFDYSVLIPVAGKKVNFVHRVNALNAGVQFRLTVTDKGAGMTYAAWREADFNGVAIPGWSFGNSSFSFIADYLTDGNAANRWVSDAVANPTIRWVGDKGALADYTTLRLTNYYNSAGADRSSPAYTLDYSLDNGVTWTLFKTVTGAPTTTDSQVVSHDITAPQAATRYRIRALTAGTNNALGINELQMYASSDATGTNLATLTGGNAAIGSHNDGGYPLTNMYDGNTANFWTSLGVASPVGGHWAGMNFAAAQTIRSFRVMFRNGFNEWPTSYWIERSTDGGVTWVTVKSGGGLAGGVWHVLDL